MTKSIKIIHGLVILAILGFAFYWYEWRPTQIRKDCINYVNSGTLSGTPNAEQLLKINFINENEYNKCIKQHGLGK